MVALTYKKLTGKRLAFVREYLIDFNATQAYLRAGYKCTEEAARRLGSLLLTNVDIQEAIREAQQAMQRRTEVDADRVVKELAIVGFSDIGELMDFSGDQVKLLPAYRISERARRSISSIKVKRYLEGNGEDAKEVEVVEFKLWDKLSALEKIGKHLGIFAENGGDNNTQVNIQIIEQTVVRKEGVIIDGIMPVEIIEEEVVPNGQPPGTIADGISTSGSNGRNGTAPDHPNGHKNGSTLP